MSKDRRLVLHPAAREDLLDIWRLINRNDGQERADRVVARIEAFVRSLEEFANVGRMHDAKIAGLRSVSIPGLKRAVLLFRTTEEHVIVIRVAYLGRDVFSALPEI